MKTLSLLASLLLASAACGASSPATTEPTTEPASDPVATEAAVGDIVDVAAGNPDFETLVAAVKAAGLVDTLKGPGPFTVFAPTDDAFAKLPPGTLDSLLADPEALKRVLTYHVVAGRVMAADVVKLDKATTVAGLDLAIDATAGVRVNGATVTTADLVVKNGVIHVIDTVLVPR
jgi:uncharacterized surface protein with fasciclin (FAS1) repeats